MDQSPGQASSSAASLGELDALLEHPERWPEIEPDRLRHLLFYRCLSYGLHPDEAAIPTLMSLHRLAVERLHAAVRRQVVVHLARAIERVHREHQLEEGAGCTNALLPFLLEDPDPSVVSSAAMEMALLLPLEEGDVLTGPRYVRHLWKQVGADDARAGIVAGLLQLGDERLSPLVDGAWDELGHEGRETLALLVQAFHGVNGLTVRFLVSWLEHEVRDSGSAAFGMVAATLARAGRHAEEHGVAEFERVFPLAHAPQDAPAGAGRQLTFDEFRPSIAGRLVQVGRSEAPPRLMPHVLSYWGLDEEAYRLAVAAAVASSMSDQTATARGPDPVRIDLVPAWPEEPENETLIEWGIFNPLGPTINTLRLTAAAGALALVYTLYHPTGSVSRVMAVLPADAGGQAVLSAVAGIMAANGSHGIWLVRSLPDYVHLPSNGGIDRWQAASGLAAARDAALSAGEERIDLGWHATRLVRLSREPWGTANQELEEARRGDLHRDAGGRPVLEDYVRWLDVAASPDHVETIRSEMPTAWQRVVQPAEDAGEV